MRVDDYVRADTFRAKALHLCEEAVAGLPAAPTLVAFPELIGLPLLLALGNERGAQAKSIFEAVSGLLRDDWRGLLRSVRRERSLDPRVLYAWRGTAAYAQYHDVFAEAARAFGVTVVAGSSFLPSAELEVTRGVHVVGRRAYNTSLTFGPTGTLLGQTRKCYLMPAEARAGLSRARASELPITDTPVGKLGVAICLDAYYHTVMAHLDGGGARVVVQPSANDAPWERPWPADPSRSEGEAWLEHGLRASVQNRLNIRLGVNPMLVGELWELAPRGRSSIVANRRYYPGVTTEGYEGVLALAQTADQQAFVRATVAVPEVPEG